MICNHMKVNISILLSLVHQLVNMIVESGVLVTMGSSPDNAWIHYRRVPELTVNPHAPSLKTAKSRMILVLIHLFAKFI